MPKVARSQHFIKFLAFMDKAGITRDKAITLYYSLKEESETVEITDSSIKDADSSAQPQRFSSSSERLYPRDD